MNPEKTNELIKGLNDMQKAAVLHTEGPLLLLAGAGSGKTSVLTHRIAYLVELGVSPFNILAITFTNKAAREMRERVNALIPQGEQIWVSTFHSMCVRILRKEIDKIFYENKFTIYDADDAERIIKSCLKELDLSEKQFSPRAVMAAISSWKNELLNPDNVASQLSLDFRQAQINKVYTVYQRRLRDSNSLDFDDIIFKAVELFVARPDVLARYQERFQYIMVDEYQDTNTAQYNLVRLLSGKYLNLCVVGDDDQSIYGWRGANIRNILDFEKDYSGAISIKLEQNYRSSKTILQAANAVIQNNFSRKNKSLWTDNENGEKINYHRAASDLDEGTFVSETIMDGVKSNSRKYKDFAVLYRNNAQSRVMEDMLVRNSIPYRLFGGVRFYERKEVKDILAYLRFIYNTKDEIAFMRIINVPRRGIGDTSIDKIVQYSNKKGISAFEALDEMENIEGLGTRAKKITDFQDLILDLIQYALSHSALEVLNKLIFDTNFILDLQSEGTEEAKSRVENVQELVSKAAEFEKSNEDASLGNFLEEIALVADIDNYKEDDDAVVLMTLHSSKGLEFPVVFMTGFEEGVFPSYRSVVSGDIKDLEEERRLCYVGITRAKRFLYITSATSRMQHGQTTYNSPSRFLKEIPPELLETGTKPSLLTQAVQSIMAGGNKGSTASKQNNKATVQKESLKSYSQRGAMPIPKNAPIDFVIGDRVKQSKYGIGVVLDIRPAGADYEVAVEFNAVGVKKFMAHLSKLEKVE